jgi:Fe-Mn family superoxide dismutase
MFTLPKLNYSYDALAPYIDAKTMEIHLTKHHQAYIDNLNKALEKYPTLKTWTLEELLLNLKDIPEDIRTTVQNNAGGHYNHTLFWQMMAPKNKVIKGKFEQELIKQFGSRQAFVDTFETAAKTRFGSGWAWLVLDPRGKMKIYSTPNQDAPVMTDDLPLLGLDVWEHAYYLNYQNRRPDYIVAWWNVVNWEFVEQNYRKITE